MKSLKLLVSFVIYCLKNPHLRFWQALRNWSDYLIIYGERNHGELEDTFYL